MVQRKSPKQQRKAAEGLETKIPKTKTISPVKETVPGTEKLAKTKRKTRKEKIGMKEARPP